MTNLNPLQFIRQSIDRLTSSDASTFDYRSMAEELRTLSGAKYVVINEKDPGNDVIITKAISGVRDDMKRAASKLGIDLIGATWEPDDFVLRVSACSDIHYFGTVAEVASNQLPELLCKTVAKMFNVGPVYGIGLCDNGRDLGYVLFLVSRNEEPRNREHTELLTKFLAAELGKDRLAKYRPEQQEKSDRLPQFPENSSLRIPEVFYQLDADGKIVFVNNSVTRYGYSREELFGKNIFDIIHPDDREKAKWKINERRTGKRHTENLEIRILTKERRPVHFHVHGRSIEIDPVMSIEAEGLYKEDVPKRENFKGTMGIVRDITEQKVLKLELAEKEKIFKGITDNIQEVIWLEQFDPMRILYVNPAVKDVYGITPEDAYRDPDYWMRALHPEDKEEIEKALKSEEFVNGFLEYRIVVNGETRWIRSTIFPIKQGNGSAVQWNVGIAEDITTLKEREQELTNSLETNRMLLREIYHRVKNNLMVVESILSLQASDIEDPATKEIISQIQSRIQTVGIIHEMLYRQEKYESLRIDTYLSRLLTHLIDSLVESFERIRLETDMCEGEVNPKRAIPVGLIFTELIINILKYAFPHPKQGTIRTTLSKSESMYTLTIMDNGGGFPTAEQQQTHETKGSGLGFTLIEAFAEQLDGSFSISTQESWTISELHFPRE